MNDVKIGTVATTNSGSPRRGKFRAHTQDSVNWMPVWVIQRLPSSYARACAMKDQKPTIYILSGLPGSGKSHYARSLGIPVVSADDYFIGSDGAYQFDPRDLSKAHGQCFRRALALACGNLRKPQSFCVDNTNTTAIEIAPYVAMAQAYSMEHLIVLVYCPPEEAFARQTHGIPRRAFDAMASRIWAQPYPPWWNATDC